MHSHKFPSPTNMLPSSPPPSPIPSRRSLPYLPLENPGPAESKPNKTTQTTASNFDAGVIAIVAAMVCAVIIGLVLNAIVRFTVQAVKQMWARTEPSPIDQTSQLGAQRKAVSALPTLIYSGRVGSNGFGSECTICLSEFVAGERVRVLPKCGHGFHADCVDRWLTDHSSCPMCRQCSFGGGQLMVGCTEPVGAEMGSSQVVSLSVDVEDLMESCGLCCC